MQEANHDNIGELTGLVFSETSSRDPREALCGACGAADRIAVA